MLPEPRSGLVIGYSYLWFEEFERGLEEGRKDRPCAIVVATRTEDGDLVVTVAAITHVRPADPRGAIEVPPEVKRTLGLDDQPSWVVCGELNRFVWPGPDLRPISRTAPGQFVHGTLPGPFLRRVFERIMVLRQERRMRVVMR
jgi:hypothetical protein